MGEEGIVEGLSMEEVREVKDLKDVEGVGEGVIRKKGAEEEDDVGRGQGGGERPNRRSPLRGGGGNTRRVTSGRRSWETMWKESGRRGDVEEKRTREK